MKKLMFIFTFLIVVFFISKDNLLYAIAPNVSVSYSFAQPLPVWNSPYFEEVYVMCNEYLCTIECAYPGWKECNWDEAMKDCRACIEGLDGNGTVGEEADVQEMTEYAVEQVKTNNINNGSYSLNRITSAGTTYYRTVTWDYNENNDDFEVIIVISYYDPNK